MGWEVVEVARWKGWMTEDAPKINGAGTKTGPLVTYCGALRKQEAGCMGQSR